MTSANPLSLIGSYLQHGVLDPHGGVDHGQGVVERGVDGASVHDRDIAQHRPGRAEDQRIAERVVPEVSADPRRVRAAAGDRHVGLHLQRRAAELVDAGRELEDIRPRRRGIGDRRERRPQRRAVLGRSPVAAHAHVGGARQIGAGCAGLTALPPLALWPRGTRRTLRAGRTRRALRAGRTRRALRAGSRTPGARSAAVRLRSRTSFPVSELLRTSAPVTNARTVSLAIAVPPRATNSATPARTWALPMWGGFVHAATVPPPPARLYAAGCTVACTLRGRGARRPRRGSRPRPARRASRSAAAPRPRSGRRARRAGA